MPDDWDGLMNRLQDESRIMMIKAKNGYVVHVQNIATGNDVLSILREKYDKGLGWYVFDSYLEATIFVSAMMGEPDGHPKKK